MIAIDASTNRTSCQRVAILMDLPTLKALERSLCGSLALEPDADLERLRSAIAAQKVNW